MATQQAEESQEQAQEAETRFTHHYSQESYKTTMLIAVLYTQRIWCT